MRTACLENVHGSVSVATMRCHVLGSQMKKFELVSSDHHRMSLLGGGGGGLLGLMSERGQGLTYSEVQYIMGNYHTGDTRL